MTISLGLISGILVVHYFGDFICQTRTMANNKSTSTKWLSIHVATYTFIIGLLLSITTMNYFSFTNIIIYSLINGLLHFAIDFVTSKMTSHFYKKEDYYSFFAIIGADQLIHLLCLFSTLGILGVNII